MKRLSPGNEEPGNHLKISIFKNADPLHLGRSLIEGNKDHFLSQARSELKRQEHQVGSLNNCISETHNTDLSNLTITSSSTRGITLNEKVLRDTQIRSMHEMGEMKRSQELFDEVSMQKLRENHETIQKLTSQLQEVQDLMNSMNDSGDFQEVESNYTGRWPGRWEFPRQVKNRRRRTREGPEPACVQTPFHSGMWHMQGEKVELTSCRGTAQSAWQKPPERRKGGRAGLPARESGRHVVRG